MDSILTQLNQFLVDAAEAQIHIGFRKSEREIQSGGLAVYDPFVHAPEVAVFQIDAERVDHLRDDRELFGRADRSADAGGLGRSGFLPRLDVFEGFRRIEFLQRVVDIDLEPGTFVVFQGVDGDLGGIVEDGAVERGVIPPVFRDLAECADFRFSHLKFLPVES